MFLATIVCNRDFQQMLLQAESIGQFVEPCVHVIVVNEHKPDIDFWYKWLAPYYKNHTLLIYPAIIPNDVKDYELLSGWVTQQWHKFIIAHLAYYKCLENYVLLDSKNFFVKPTKLDEFEYIIGSGVLSEEAATGFSDTNNHYAKLFNVDPIKETLAPFTPFVIDASLIRNSTTMDSLKHIFFETINENPIGFSTSEFIFYSYLIKEQLVNYKSKSIGTSLWEKDIDSLSSKLYGIYSANFKVYGIHRDLLNNIYPSALDYINDWLYNKVGLKNKFYPTIKK